MLFVIVYTWFLVQQQEFQQLCGSKVVKLGTITPAGGYHRKGGQEGDPVDAWSVKKTMEILASKENTWLWHLVIYV